MFLLVCVVWLAHVVPGADEQPSPRRYHSVDRDDRCRVRTAVIAHAVGRDHHRRVRPC